MTGLVVAARNYRASQDGGFAAYASTHIRGAILGELRRLDWMSRSSRSKAKRLGSALTRLEQQHAFVAKLNAAGSALVYAAYLNHQLLTGFFGWRCSSNRPCRPFPSPTPEAERAAFRHPMWSTAFLVWARGLHNHRPLGKPCRYGGFLSA